MVFGGLGTCFGAVLGVSYWGAVLGNLSGAWVLEIWFLGLGACLGGIWSTVLCMVLGLWLHFSFFVFVDGSC